MQIGQIFVAFHVHFVEHKGGMISIRCVLDAGQKLVILEIVNGNISHVGPP
jgi:hypothetical protein